MQNFSFSFVCLFLSETFFHRFLSREFSSATWRGDNRIYLTMIFIMGEYGIFVCFFCRFWSTPRWENILFINKLINITDLFKWLLHIIKLLKIGVNDFFIFCSFLDFIQKKLQELDKAPRVSDHLWRNWKADRLLN